MDALLLIRITSIVCIAVAYMAFDLFNRRNVPTAFAYGTIAYGVLLTLLYLASQDYATMAYSFVVAGIVFGLGYLVYRTGQIGLGDVTELTAVSLVLPFSAPLLVGTGQFGLPFVISIVIASGIAALIVVPLFYIPIARKRRINDSRNSRVKAIVMGSSYMVFIAFATITGIATAYGVVILGALMIGSVLTILFERSITKSMIAYVPANKLEQEDMLAMNMLSARSRSAWKRRVKSFGQLVTPKMLKEIRRKRIRGRLPVYRNGIPFAVPILIGIVVSLLFGNLIILAL